MSSSTTPSTPTAASKVFAIPELLENVLVHTDTVTLYRLERTNSTFKGVIAGSRALRRRMFKEGPAEINELCDLIEHPAIKRATSPFEAERRLFGKDRYQAFIFKLSREWLDFVDPYFVFDDMLCKRPAWWRGVKVGAAFKGVKVYYDSPDSFIEHSNVAEDTLGDVVDVMVKDLDRDMIRGLVFSQAIFAPDWDVYENNAAEDVEEDEQDTGIDTESEEEGEGGE